MSGCVFWPGCLHAVDDECGRDELRRQEEDRYLVDDDDGDDEGFAEMACGRRNDGGCDDAGSEFCDFGCPYRASLYPRAGQ